MRSEKTSANSAEPAKRREKWGQKNGPLLSFCPHLFAFKVEEASRLLPVQEQRRAAAATSPVLCAVNFEP